MIVSEVVDESGVVLGCLARDITKTLVSPEVYFYWHFANVFMCANAELQT